VLRLGPPKLGWAMEWLGDVTGLACSLFFVWYGARATAASYFAGSLSIKTLIFPEWWMLAPTPICLLLVAVEFIFRMRLLAQAERAPRPDAVSAS
jgi:TRAP-type C4-dicarboxylate transport system permease small subunit